MKIAVLGLAHGHVNAYLAAWRANPGLGIETVAGWDHDAARLSEGAHKHGFAASQDLDALLARREIEAVVIASETSRHADLAIAAARAGKRIVLQKPLALTLEEADAIVHAIDTHTVPFTLAWQMRVDPENLRMRQILASGCLGRLQRVRRRHCLSTHLWPHFPTTWHVDPALNRDIWADDAAHAMDFLYWLLGMPLSVTAELATCIDPRIPQDNGIAIFRYPDDVIAEVSCTFAAPAGENTTEIVGDQGVLIQNYGDQPSSQAPRPAGGVRKGS